MNKVRLGDVATYINGYAFKPDDRGSVGLPIIRIQDLTGNSYDLGFYDGEYPERIEINDGDVLISWSASLGVYVWNKGKALLNQHIFKVVFDKLEIDKQFFVYAVEHNLQEMVKQTHGATMKHIIKKDFDNTLIPYPPLEQQKRIAKLLDKTCDLIEKMKMQVSLLDKLIKSRFVEMFGDPIINPFNWDELVIANVLRGKASNGFFAKRDEYCDNGNVSILGVTNIVNRMYSNCDNLPKTNANNTSIEKYRVQYGDMLFCRSSLVAEGIGKASIVPTNIPDNVLFECHVIRLPLDTNKVIPEYLQVLTTLDFFRNQVLASAKTATMTTIGQDGILKCNIILPPYKMQQEYLAYINQINKIKTIINQSIEKLETLKKSLMQEYFG